MTRTLQHSKKEKSRCPQSAGYPSRSVGGFFIICSVHFGGYAWFVCGFLVVIAFSMPFEYTCLAISGEERTPSHHLPRHKKLDCRSPLGDLQSNISGLSRYGDFPCGLQKRGELWYHQATITSERKGRKQYVPCFAAAAVNSGEQNSSNQIYDFRIFHSKILHRVRRGRWYEGV